MNSSILLLVALLIAPSSSALAGERGSLGIDAVEPTPDRFLLSNVQQLTYEGRRSKEGYFSGDGSRIVFQSERAAGNPFYQTYVLDLTTGRSTRVSTGEGRTTRATFHPDGHQVLFDSTHADDEVLEEQAAELEDRVAGDPDRFDFVFDPDLDLYLADLASRRVQRLTDQEGYDAEGVFSPDGRWIAFASNRHAYAAVLDPEVEDRLEVDPSYFIDIYLMRSDGTEVRRLTDRPGYDGGPVFSPDGSRIAWRRFEPDDGTAELYTMGLDGGDERQLTQLDQISWAAFYHPSGDYMIFSSNRYGLGNYELYIIDAEGRAAPAQVTQAGGYDGLPAFAPDGRRLAWTGRHDEEMLSQLFVADWNDGEARRRLRLASAAPLRALGPAQVAAERSDEEGSDEEVPDEATPPGRRPLPPGLEPGGIEDPTADQGRWSGRHTFALTRSLSRSTIRPWLKSPLYVATVAADVVLLPVTLIVGFID